MQTEIEYKEFDYKLIKRLLKFLKPYMRFIILATALTLVVTALGPLRPYLTKIAIDDFIQKNNSDGLIKIILLIVGVMVIHGTFQFLLTYLMQWVGQKVLLDIRLKLFEHIQNLALKFFDKNPVGRLVTRVTNDVEVLNEMFSSGVVMIVADILLIFWIIGFMFWTDWKLTLISLSILPVLFGVTSVFRKKVRVVFRDIRLNVSRLNSFLNEFITGITTVKLFSRENPEKVKFDEMNVENKDLWIKNIFYYASFFPAVELLSTISLALLLWWAAGHIITGLMTLGTLIAFLQYSEMFFRPVRDLTEKYTTLQAAMASSERIFSLLDTDVSLSDNDYAVELTGFHNSIEFRNVNFSYDESKQVLKDVSFKVNKGETVAIVGATGAGKTSIINLLTRMYDFQEGDILIDGKSIRGYQQESMRSKIALVMQDVFLFSRSIAENISLGDESVDLDKVKTAAISLGASDFIERLDGGYHSQVNERGSTLSTGQRQLISFARAFAANPEILILDEATSNIDSETEQLIENSLEKLLSHRTSIVIAHRLSTIKRADKIIVLHHGEVREIGTHKELLENGGLYSRLYELQFSKI